MNGHPQKEQEPSSNRDSISLARCTSVMLRHLSILLNARKHSILNACRLFISEVIGQCTPQVFFPVA